MSDVFIFGIGCLVSLIVASAVGLLLWGAANEPSSGEAVEPEALKPDARARSERTTHPDGASLEAQSPA